MQIANIPKNETLRLEKLRQLLILDTPAEDIFDNLAKLANHLCGTPIAFISMVDNDRQWFKSVVGLEGVTETPRDIAFCAHTIMNKDVLEVCDASTDPRFMDNPLVKGYPHILFYAGAPIMLENEVVGTLSVIDSKVKSLTSFQKNLIKELADYTACIMMYRKNSMSQNTKISNLLSGIVQTSEDAIVSKTLDGIVTSWNEGAENIFGYQAHEIIGKSITCLFPKELIDEEESLVGFIKQGQQILHYETVRMKKNGEKIDVSVSLSPIKDSSGNIIGASKIARNITNRKIDERRIKKLGNLYRSVSAINQAIIRLGSEAELLPLISSCAVEYDEMNMAFVAQLDEHNTTYHLVAENGFNPEQAHQIANAIQQDAPQGDGLIATVFRDSRPVIIQNILSDPITNSWKSLASEHNWGAAAGFPIQKNGIVFAVLVVCSMELNAFNDEITFHLYEMARDVSFALDNFEREAERQAAAESLKLAASVFESSLEGIQILDAQNIVVAVNPAFTKITGFNPAEVIGFPPQHFASSDHDREMHSIMWNEVHQFGFWQGEVWDQRKNGEMYPRWQTVSTMLNEDGSIQKHIVMFADNSAKREAEHKIWLQANFDSLTGLPNRQMFFNRLQHQLKKSSYDGSPFALMFVDIDRFKEINDILGHDKGDEVLQAFGRRIHASVNAVDTVARLGDDEFTIILGEAHDEQHIETLAQQILENLSQDIQFNELTLNITASIGIARYPRDGTSPEILLKKADQAVNAAKDSGKNCYAFYTQSMQQSSLFQIQIASDLKNALNDNQFWLAYQPIIELATGNIYKAEALIRWRHPNKVISPAVFIPVAERCGLIHPIGEFVFQESLKQVKQWQQSLHPDFQISINKSPLQFRHGGNHAKCWRQSLEENGLRGNSIAVEITEGLLLDNHPNITQTLAEYRNAGISISIDDFGTGYSALSYLKKFEVDYLKIDKSFVDQICHDHADLALCEAMILMAHKLDIKVIAEGVETPEQLALLKQIGCDYGQGYLWSKPVCADEFEALFRKSATAQPILACA